MEDLASEFREDFLEAVKVLEDFSSSDGALREAMREVRRRIDDKAYVCAPNFWADLRESLQAVERQRNESSAKSKAQQVLKQVARLEVRFWAKESIGMLRELDAESRLERMRDWVLTFDSSEGGDQSSGPAVLYQVLSDVSLQKDLEAHQRDSLLSAVRENLHKFPVEMQAVLERVGSLQGAGGPQVLSDWRRRNQPTSQEQVASGGSTRLSFVPLPKAASLLGAPDLSPLGQAPGGELAGPLAGQALTGLGAFAGVLGAGAGAGTGAGPVTWTPRGGPTGLGTAEDGDGEPEGEGLGLEGLEGEGPAGKDGQPSEPPFDLASVEPALLERARRAVTAALEANAGECGRQHVRTLLRQAGLERMPLAALGPTIFSAPAEVFVRRPEAIAPAPVAPAAGSAVPEELRRQMATLVREADGRMPLGQLVEALQWHQGSIRYTMHGPLRRAVLQVPELFFEPKKVFTRDRARQLITALASEAEEVPQEGTGEGAAGNVAATAAPYVADPFAELLAGIRTWLQQEEGVLEQEVVLPLVKAMGFKLRAVIAALSGDVFWSHPEAECEILLRTPVGAVQHPKPLPKVYLHEVVHQKLVTQIKTMGSKAKLDKLAGALGWNAKSELRKAYGTLRVVLTGLREVFFDPARLYHKRSLEGLVEWPVNRDGRLGPQAEDAPLQHWTPAADDPKAASDPTWLGVRRQILGTLLRRGGACEADALRSLLQPLEGAELEQLLEPGSPYDLSALLLWPRDIVYCRRPEAVAAASAAALADENTVVPAEARLALADVVRRQGPLRVDELRAALESGGTGVGLGDPESLLAALPQIPELFFAPNVVLLRRTAESAAILSREAEDSMQPAERPSAAAAAVAEAMVEASKRHSQVAEAMIEAKAAVEANLPALGDSTGAGGAARAGTGTGTAQQFFSFSEFTPLPLGSPQQEEEGEQQPERSADAAELERAAGQPAAKRPRTGEPESQVSWTEEVPPWAIDGAAVTLREGGQDGVIVAARGASCRVQLLGGQEAGQEQELSTPALLPVSPSVGVQVRVVAGERSGCQGKLVGLAGASGVVQIAGMSYETLPMSQLVALAS